MTALNIYFPKLQNAYKFLSVGKEVYPPVDDDKRIILSTGKELRKGFKQSLRIGWGKLSYNLKYYAYKIIMFRLIYY